MNAFVRLIAVLASAGVAFAVSLGTSQFAGSGIAGASVSACPSSWLTAQMGRSSAAAGTAWYTLEIVNHSKASCSLHGTPIARPGFMTYGMVPWENVGPQAGIVKFAGRGGTVVLRPGHVASVDFGVTTAANYPRSKCAPRTIEGVELSFRSGAVVTRLSVFMRKQAVCSKFASTSITGIALGVHLP